MAKRLEAAAARLAKALESTCAIDEGGDIAREGPASVWPFLRIAELMGPQAFSGDAASALRYGKSFPEVRRFDIAAGPAPALLHRVRALERQARIASEVFRQRGHPQSVLAARLGVELEMIWEALAGKKAAYSSEATFDAPPGIFQPLRQIRT
jgi:hypothetical protein